MYEELKAEMKKQGISGNRLAIQALISPSDYYSAINGNKPFYPAWRKRIAEILSVNENDIFSDGIKLAQRPLPAEIVDVIRCKNCAHAWFDENVPDQFNCGALGVQYMTDFDFFCAYGITKEEYEANNG